MTKIGSNILWLYYDPASVPQWPQKQSQSISLSTYPPDPPSNPPSENPGYGPACPVLSTKTKSKCDSQKASLVKLSLHT